MQKLVNVAGCTALDIFFVRVILIIMIAKLNLFNRRIRRRRTVQSGGKGVPANR
jgi:hypothetical protein